MKRKSVSILLSIVAIFTFTQATAAGAETPLVDECGVALAYQAAFERQPSLEALQYWYEVGSISHLAVAPEGPNLDPAAWYKRILGRNGDAAGIAYWQSMDPAHALNGFVHTEEVRASGFCDGLPELTRISIGPTKSEPTTMVGIINAAADEFGVSRSMMHAIAKCESGYNPNAKNPRSSASGLFQHLARYWPARAEAVGMPGASVFDPVANARAAALMMSEQGSQPWYPSRHCSGY